MCWRSTFFRLRYAPSLLALPTLSGLVSGLPWPCWLGGWVIYHQSLGIAALIGIALIVAGVIVLNLFSKAVVH
ncbi:hypothetical protein [Methyloglobulus sp.]|uniref:hypothetical protein n=1 Tax=Methyloglobulus sp. TaxID=2518622 RepID=UPI003988ABC5